MQSLQTHLCAKLKYDKILIGHIFRQQAMDYQDYNTIGKGIGPVFTDPVSQFNTATTYNIVTYQSNKITSCSGKLQLFYVNLIWESSIKQSVLIITLVQNVKVS